jgi:anthranilate synthase/aminodeoxychorismate synthase-like glutamine amidotransferase
LKVLLIDFYDSFTYNIYHYLISLGVSVDVVEDRELHLTDVERYDCIVLSPGPGLPNETRSLFDILETYGGSKKILGVCLGMQGIAEFYGGKLYNQKSVRHGVSVKMDIIESNDIFYQLPKSFSVGLYHSWAVDISETILLKPLAVSEDKVIIAIKHVELPIYGVQFHPESVLTEFGKEMFFNFLYTS